MALIGTGTKVIPNVVSTSTWRSQDIDQGLAAFAEQLGGNAFSAGAPLLYPGNLEAANFVSGMLMGEEYLKEPNHYSAISIHCGTASASVTAYADHSTRVTSAHIGIADGAFPVGFTGNVVIKVNGATAVTIPTNINLSTSVPEYTSSVGANFTLKSGDAITVDFSGIAVAGGTVKDVTVVLVTEWRSLT